jgi:hypothetical protein
MAEDLAEAEGTVGDLLELDQRADTGGGTA